MTKVQATAPNPLATIGIGWAHYQLGDPARGISSFIEYFTMLGDAPVADVLRQHHAAGDWAGAARAAADVLAERSRTTFVKPMNIAILYDWAGDLDRAMEWLDRSYDLRDHEMAYLSAMPPFSPRLRADPRFQGMLDRLNLPG